MLLAVLMTLQFAQSSQPPAAAVAERAASSSPFAWVCRLHFRDESHSTVTGEFEANQLNPRFGQTYDRATARITEQTTLRFDAEGFVQRSFSTQPATGGYTMYIGDPQGRSSIWRFNFRGIGRVSVVEVDERASASELPSIDAVGLCEQSLSDQGVN